MISSWHYRLQEPGIRYLTRQPPLWMKLNMHDGNCWCGTKPIKPRRKYCCQTHADLWYFSIRGYWDGIRQGILRLFDYTCAECGFTPDKKYGRDQYFDVDHEIAIALGGMCYDIDNLRPLCKKCHKIKTAQDIKKIVMIRKKLQPLENFA